MRLWLCFAELSYEQKKITLLRQSTSTEVMKIVFHPNWLGMPVTFSNYQMGVPYFEIQKSSLHEQSDYKKLLE